MERGTEKIPILTSPSGWSTTGVAEVRALPMRSRDLLPLRYVSTSNRLSQVAWRSLWAGSYTSLRRMARFFLFDFERILLAMT